MELIILQGTKYIGPYIKMLYGVCTYCAGTKNILKPPTINVIITYRSSERLKAYTVYKFYYTEVLLMLKKKINKK